jgi:hypothetical protein
MPSLPQAQKGTVARSRSVINRTRELLPELVISLGIGRRHANAS